MSLTTFRPIGRRTLLTSGALAGVVIPSWLGAQSIRPSRAVHLGPYTTPSDAIIKTSSGAIRGYKNGDIYTFKGVAYGADTSGPNRFMPPRLPLPWSEIRPALVWGYACPQVTSDASYFMRLVAFADTRLQGEDCLNLNVFTPTVDRRARLPVVIWLHGGGFQAGSSREQVDYDGTNLAARGCVFVSVNHRLGALGFLNLQAAGDAFDSSPNVGMLDLVAALKWVRDNIEAFGGDPECVTIAGQSGGGMKVSALMAMPAAKGLFHRAIVMSGSPEAFWSLGQSAAVAETVAMTAGAAPNDAAALQQIPVDKLVAASRGTGPSPFGIPWQPSVHPRDLPADWSKGAPRQSADIPLIVGSVRDEFRELGATPISEAQLHERISKRFGSQADAVIASLRAALPGTAPLDIASAVTGLSWRAKALDQVAKQIELGGAPVFEYWHVFSANILEGGVGVPHGSDVGYFFDNADKDPALSGQTEAAYALAEKMSRALLTFAKTGNPATSGVPWTKFEASRINTLVVAANPHMVDAPAGVALEIDGKLPPLMPF